MKLNIEVRVVVDHEVTEFTGYPVNEIEEIVSNIPFSNLKVNEFSVITLPNKLEIKIFPVWTNNNILMITVTCN